jgi:glutaredoxin
MDKELVMYHRTSGCPYVTIARKVLQQNGIPYREILWDKNPEAERYIRETTGFLPAPTLVVTNPGEDNPYESPAELKPGKSPRGIDRGAMISEPNARQLTNWLKKHGFITD